MNDTAKLCNNPSKKIYTKNPTSKFYNVSCNEKMWVEIERLHDVRKKITHNPRLYRTNTIRLFITLGMKAYKNDPRYKRYADLHEESTTVGESNQVQVLTSLVQMLNNE